MTAPRLDSRVDAQAAEWFARRQGKPLSAAEEDRFYRWLLAHPAHAECYGRYERDWEELDLLPETSVAADPIPLHPHRSRRPFWLGAAFVAAAMIVLAFVLTFPRQPEAPHYVLFTDTAVFKKLELPDGSTIRLNAGTAVAIDFGPATRQVELQKGEAFFTVAKDAAHPFIVFAGNHSVRAVGTAFNVTMRRDSLEVLVTEGKVAVEDKATGRNVVPENARSGATPVIVAGEKLTIPRGSNPTALPAVDPVTPPETSAALAWQAKLLEFEDRPLGEIVREFNRYNQRQLIINDPALAQRTFGGTFRADNQGVLIELLEAQFNVVAERHGNEIVLRPRR